MADQYRELESESEIRNRIAVYLGSNRHCLVIRVNVGKGRALHDPLQVIDFGPRKGTSDLICCIMGRFVAIEVKSSTGKQSDEQIKFQAAVERRKGIYILARSVEDVVNTLAQHGLMINEQVLKVDADEEEPLR